MTVQNLKIKDIIIKDRYRKDKGDILSLSKSIEKEGLINPILITENNILIAGERRILAYKHAKRTHIPAHVISIVDDGQSFRLEYAENEERKPFTLSEKTEMLKVITPKQGGIRASGPNGPLETTTEERRTTLAEAVGFNSSQEAKRSKRIMRDGSQQIIDLVDEGIITVSTAAERICKLPEEEQIKIAEYIKEFGVKNWKNYLYHKTIRKALENNDIDSDQADGFQNSLDSKKRTLKEVRVKIQSISRSVKIGKAQAVAKTRHDNQKQEKEDAKWTTIKVSKVNIKQSLKNLIIKLDTPNKETILEAIHSIYRVK